MTGIDMKEQIKLYFDNSLICLGGCANNWWLHDYSGEYFASDYFLLPIGYDPVGKSFDEIKKG